MKSEQARMEEKSLELGRKIIEAEIKCDCGGSGIWLGMECDRCDGTGRVMEWVFESCRHVVESEECYESDCLCELMQDDQGERCDRPYYMTVHEPYTPASFGIRCCKECAESQIRFGYLKGEAA